MIHLTEITQLVHLDAYHRFRATIYKNDTAADDFLKNKEYDRDLWDEKAIHLGWYNDVGALNGCIRFIRPIDHPCPLYSFTRLPRPVLKFAEQLLCSHERQKLPLLELSRICVSQEFRNLRSLRDFSLAIIEKLFDYSDQAFFTVFDNHKAHWMQYGCSVLEGTAKW